MYEAFWQLQKKPFENTSDVGFYYPSEAHQGAQLKLRYAIENRRGSGLLSGASGLGKTLLLRTLASQLDECFHPWVHVVFPQMPPDQLVAYVADELTGERSDATPTVRQSVQRIDGFLKENIENGRHAVLILDEAHLLDRRALETVRLLLNFEHSSAAPMTVLLIGQPALLPVLDRTPQLDERLAVKCLLPRFQPEETAAYVQHRLTVAGATRELFQHDALDALHNLCHGIPRQINRLADLALLVGFAEDRPAIEAAQLEAIADELVTVAAA